MVGEGAVGELDARVFSLAPYFQASESNDQRPGAGVIPRDADFAFIDDLNACQFQQQKRRQKSLHARAPPP